MEKKIIEKCITEFTKAQFNNYVKEKKVLLKNISEDNQIDILVSSFYSEDNLKEAFLNLTDKDKIFFTKLLLCKKPASFKYFSYIFNNKDNDYDSDAVTGRKNLNYVINNFVVKGMVVVSEAERYDYSLAKYEKYNVYLPDFIRKYVPRLPLETKTFNNKVDTVEDIIVKIKNVFLTKSITDNEFVSNDTDNKTENDFKVWQTKIKAVNNKIMYNGKEIRLFADLIDLIFLSIGISKDLYSLDYNVIYKELDIDNDVDMEINFDKYKDTTIIYSLIKNAYPNWVSKKSIMHYFYIISNKHPVLHDNIDYEVLFKSNICEKIVKSDDEYYRVLPIVYDYYELNKFNPASSVYYKKHDKKKFVVDIKKTDLIYLVEIMITSDFTIDKNLLIFKPSLDKMLILYKKKLFEYFIILNEKKLDIYNIYKKNIKYIISNYGRTLIHSNISIIKISDIGIMTLLCGYFDEIIKLNNQYCAIPKFYITSVEEFLKRNNYSIKIVE